MPPVAGGGRGLSAGAAGGSGPLLGMFGSVSRRGDIATPAPGRDPSAAAGESGGGGERGCGSGEGECGLKWPRRAAGGGCAVREGLSPGRHAGKGAANPTGESHRSGQPPAPALGRAVPTP